MKKIRVRKSRRRSRRTEKPVELESLPKLNLNAAGIDVGSREQWVAVPEGRDDREQLPAKKQRKRGGNEPIIDVRSPIYAVTGTDITELPGLGSYSVLKIISEIGTDMSKWPSAKNFTSWITLAPRNKITGGRVISSKTRPSSNRVADTLRMAAQTISRTDTALGAFYRQKAANRGKTKAITATARKLAVLIYTLLSTGEPYRETSMANYERRHQKRSLKNLKKRAKNLGYQLVPIESEVAEAVPVGT